MPQIRNAKFKTTLLCPACPGEDDTWCFIVLPKPASDILPRRGRTGANVTLNGYTRQALLEPDGKLSHWLKVTKAMCTAAGIDPGQKVEVEVSPLERQPELAVPPDLQKALKANPQAQATWQATTTLARIDWIHWIESAKQSKTRQKRIDSGCDMLGAGKKRVCCFDPSGYYSKSLSVPETLSDSKETG